MALIGSALIVSDTGSDSLYLLLLDDVLGGEATPPARVALGQKPPWPPSTSR